MDTCRKNHGENPFPCHFCDDAGDHAHGDDYPGYRALPFFVRALALALVEACTLEAEAEAQVLG